MATCNSKTITVKIPVSYGDKNPQLKADALEALLVSANPIRNDYDLSDEDYTYIAEQRKKMDLIIANMKYHLSNKTHKEAV